MISVIWPSTLIIIILFSVLVSILGEISTALPMNTAIAAVKPPVSNNNGKVSTDKFGIREIYPTRANGGKEWFINASSPLSDKSFSLSG